MNTISMLIHGQSKCGKTYFADTAPAPRLVLDAEGGNRFTPSNKKIWDPMTEAPPEHDGTWETCIVYVRDYKVLQQTYQWLNSGQHPFRSVALDSISEIQQRCVDAIAGTSAMQTQDWGELLRAMTTLVRQFRDLTIHPIKPIEVVTIIAMTREVSGKWRPHVQGQLATTLPYYIDCIVYMFPAQLEDGTPVRRLLTQPHQLFEAGDRTGKLPAMIDNPTWPMLMQYIFGA